MGSGVQLQRLYRGRCEAFPPSIEVDCPNCGATGCPEGNWGGLSAEAIGLNDDEQMEENLKRSSSAL